jgi:hypothetical protein
MSMQDLLSWRIMFFRDPLRGGQESRLRKSVRKEAIMSSWKQLVGTVWRYGWPVVVVTAFSLAYAQPGRAASASVYVLAPKPPISLNSVETHGATPLFKRDFSIPYDTVEPLIRDEIKKTVDGSKEGTVSCTSVCPDLHWKITVKSGFAFSDKSQPAITVFSGPQDQKGVDITLHTQVQVNFDITEEVWIETVFGTKSKSADTPLAYSIDINASAKLNLWPILQSQDFTFQLSPDSDTVSGGDISIPLMPSDVSDEAEKQVLAEINKRLVDLFSAVNEQVRAEVRKDIYLVRSHSISRTSFLTRSSL